MGSRPIKRKGFGWAWEFQPVLGGPWVLCNWAVPYKTVLENDDHGKPGDEARMVRVELVPTSARNRKRYGY